MSEHILKIQICTSAHHALIERGCFTSTMQSAVEEPFLSQYIMSTQKKQCFLPQFCICKYSAFRTQKMANQTLTWTPYSPDFAPKDFLLFNQTNRDLKSRFCTNMVNLLLSKPLSKRQLSNSERLLKYFVIFIHNFLIFPVLQRYFSYAEILP